MHRLEPRPVWPCLAGALSALALFGWTPGAQAQDPSAPITTHIALVRAASGPPGYVFALEGTFPKRQGARIVELVRGRWRRNLTVSSWTIRRIVARVPGDAPLGSHSLRILGGPGGLAISNTVGLTVRGPRSVLSLRPTGSLIPLWRWERAMGRDQFTTTRLADASFGFYTRIRNEGLVLSPSRPRPAGTIPLFQWANRTTRESFTTADPAWRGSPGDERLGYHFVSVEGYILPPGPGVRGRPLFSWVSDAGDRFLTSDPAWAKGTNHLGYRFVRLEGHLPNLLIGRLPFPPPWRIPMPPGGWRGIGR